MANINTSAQLRNGTNKTDAQLQEELNKANQKLGNGEMVELFIPEAYKGAFGASFKFSVNAVEVEVPVGKKVMVSKPHFDHAQRLMKGAVLSKGQKRLTPEEVYED